MAFPTVFVDQLGREVTLMAPPQRIISLCPSLTETLVHLGVGERLVGRTRFCIHPAEVMRGIPQVGGTKEVAMDRIRALQPDLIIGEKEENTPAMIAALAAEFPVFMTDVLDLDSAQEMVLQLGAITDTTAAATQLARQVADSWSSVRRLVQPVSCLYFIWKSPWMVVGANTFIDSVLQKCGFDNVATQWEGRYPVLDTSDYSHKIPAIVLLSTEPFPFKEAQIAEIQEIIPSAVVRIVDGEMFSWYGSHMVGVENYLNLLLDDVRLALSLHD
jgi:iron complex transport system substrate-binding protein